MSAPVTAEGVCDVLQTHRVVYSSEADLQAGLAGALTGAGMDVAREVRLNARDRIDLLIDRLGIEVKYPAGWRDV